MEARGELSKLNLGGLVEEFEEAAEGLGLEEPGETDGS